MIHCTAADLEIWTHLVAEGERCVANPTRSTVDLERAAHKAQHAVMPCEPYTRANPYLQLKDKAARFAGLPAAQRAGESGELARALDAAHAALALGAAPNRAPVEAPEPARTLPFRRDIDG